MVRYRGQASGVEIGEFSSTIRQEDETDKKNSPLALKGGGEELPDTGKEAGMLGFVLLIHRRSGLNQWIQVNLPLGGLVDGQIGRRLDRRRRCFGRAILGREDEWRIHLHVDLVRLRSRQRSRFRAIRQASRGAIRTRVMIRH